MDATVVLSFLVLLCVVALVALSVGTASAASVSGYEQQNLVSDIAGIAKVTEPNLVNPWGITFGPTTPFWISNNGAGVSTLYNGSGSPLPVGSPLIVTIPAAHASPKGSTGVPTGVVVNATTDFVVSKHGVSGPARFIFAAEDGAIAGWNPSVDGMHALLKADRSATGAVYKGSTSASTSAGTFLYATNFRAGTIDVYNATFKLVHLTGSFADAQIPKGYAPFDIENIGGKLYVTYAQQDAAKHDDVAGKGHGFLDVYDTSGHLLRRFATRGSLNSPWGMALAPTHFGPFSSDLLVGNFGDGRIQAFDRKSGAFLG
jgi:uncharacterized protein (TIGR03118 family)